MIWTIKLCLSWGLGGYKIYTVLVWLNVRLIVVVHEVLLSLPKVQLDISLIMVFD